MIMDTPVNAADQALAQLREDFQGHRIWRAIRQGGKAGDWVATLRDPREGVDATVVCGSAEELRKALTLERSRASARPSSQPTKWVSW
jgi:hypothetical protein